MHIHSFIAPALIASVALLMSAMPAMAHGSWLVGPETPHHPASPPAAHPHHQFREQAPSSSISMPPGPFLQVDPNPYLYPQLPQQYQQPYADQTGTWREQQWREHQWREQQWLESQRHEREWNEHGQLDWRDWGQHDRGDRISREREGRERDWREQQGRDNQSAQENRPRAGSDASRNGQSWGYRDNRR